MIKRFMIILLILILRLIKTSTRIKNNNNDIDARFFKNIKRHLLLFIVYSLIKKFELCEEK